MCALMQW